MRFLLLLLLAGPLALSARAAQKITLDRDISAEFGPVRDQRDIGWCYANAAADMLTWKYRTPEPVSAAHVALMRNRTTGKGADAEAGMLSFAIYNYAALNRRGLCRASALEDYVFAKFNRYRDVFTMLRGLRGELGQRDPAAARAAAQRVLTELDLRVEPPAHFTDYFASADVPAEDRLDALVEWLSDRLCERGGYMPANPPVSLADIDADVSIHLSASLAQAEKRIGRVIPLPELPDWNLRNFPATVRAELAAGKPVALSYSSGFLNDAGKDFSYDDLHASVIVGVRCAEGHPCIFKVRNSWGAGCSYGNPEIQRSCLANPGYYWISASQLNRYASSIVRFRRSARP